jgi:voltage-gated potassium channel
VHARVREKAGDEQRRRPGDRVAEHVRQRAARAIATRRIFRYLASALLIVSLCAGVVAWLVDRRDFPTVGDGLWWALQTLTTVGYGDIVPRTTWGRVIGSTVIVFGVTFLSILTATVTSYIVSTDQEARTVEEHSLRNASDQETRELLQEVLSRLEAVEEKLGSRGGPDGSQGGPDPG